MKKPDSQLKLALILLFILFEEIIILDKIAILSLKLSLIILLEEFIKIFISVLFLYKSLVPFSKKLLSFP